MYNRNRMAKKIIGATLAFIMTFSFGTGSPIMAQEKDSVYLFNVTSDKIGSYDNKGIIEEKIDPVTAGATIIEIGGNDTVDDDYTITASTLEFDTAEGPFFRINYISKTLLYCTSDGASLISCNVTDDYIEVTVTSEEYSGNHTYRFPKPVEKITEIGGSDTVDDGYIISENILDFDTAEGPSFTINYISKTIVNCTSKGASLISCNVTDDYIEVTVTSDEYPGNHTYRFPRKVNSGTETDIAITGVTITQKIVDNKYTLIATPIPENATGVTYRWESSDPTIATVSDDGVVTYIAKGDIEVTITVWATDALNNTVSCSNTIKANTYVFPEVDDSDQISSYEISNNILMFDTQNGPRFEINYAEKKLISCSSEGGKLLKIEVTDGKIRVMVTSQEYTGEHTYTFNMEKSGELKAVKISLIKYEGNKVYLKATPVPENIENVTYVWRSDDETKATVEDGVVTLLTDQCNGIQIIVTASAPNSRAIISTSYIIKSNGHSVDPGPDPGDYEENYNGWKYRIDEDYVFFYKYIGNSTIISVPATANIGGKEYKVAIDGTGEGYYRPEADNPSERYDSEGNGTFPMNTKSITIAEGVELRNPRALFSGLKSLEKVSIGGWTGIAADEYNCEEMFAGCEKLKSVDLSKCSMIFESVKYMFFGCTAIENIDISGLMGSRYNYPNEEYDREYGGDEFDGIIEGCGNLKTIRPFTNVWHMSFSESDQQYPIRMNFVSGNGENRPIVTWRISSAAPETFYRVDSDDTWQYAVIDENTVLLVGTESDVKTIRIPAQMTIDKKKYNTLISGNFSFPGTVESVSFENGVCATPNLSNMFNGLETLKQVELSGLNTSSVFSYTNMFSDCTSLESVNLTGLDTSGLLSSGIEWGTTVDPEDAGMNYMFGNCQTLKSVTFGNGFKLGSAYGMFYNCKALTAIDLSGVDTSYIGARIDLPNNDYTYYGSMNSMFDGCSSLEEVTFARGFKLSSNIGRMFYGCSSLKQIDLSKCDTSGFGRKISFDEYSDDLGELFYGCTSIEKINMSSLVILAHMNYGDMFTNCGKLKILQAPKKEVGGLIEFPHTLYDKDGNGYTEFSEDMVIPNSIRLTDGTVSEVVSVKSVAFERSVIKLKIGNTAMLIPEITPEDATNQNVSWTSSNEAVATVDPYGRVTGKANGNSTITVITEDGNKTAVCRITVSESGSDGDGSGRDPGLNTSGETVDKGVHYYDAYMVKGQTYVFPAKYGNIDASSSKKDQDIAWKTSDKKTASVSGKTKVKATNITGSTSTVQIYDGATFASSEYVYRLHIVDPMIVEYGKTTLLKSITLTAGNDCTLAVAGLTGYEDKFNVTWLSSNNEIASVDNGIVSAVMKGSAKITAYVGGKAYACTVKVVDTRTIPKKIDDESSITLSPLQTASLKFSSTLFIAKNLEWISADGTLKPYNKNNTVAASTDKVSYFQNEVIRVTPAGKVTAVGVGSTTISATDQNGITQTVTITVPQPVSQTLSLNVNKTKQIKLYNVNAGKATWSSSDSRITGNIVKGKIQGVRYGTAEATCTYDPYNTGKPFEYKIMIYVENPKLDTKDSTKWSKVNAANTSGTLTLKVGDTYKVSLTDVYQDVVFTSNKPTVAFVDESGNISIRDAGKAKLTAKVNGTSITINIVSTK